MPRSLAIFDTSVGSMPRMRWPPFWKFEISVPSFEPMSTQRSSLRQAEHLRRLGVELGEVVAQQLGHAAGVGIFRREDDHRIDREAELHQLAVAAIEQRGRKPGQLPRHLADRDHLVHRRHVAERQHGLELLVAAHLAGFDRDAGAGAGGAGDFCWEHGCFSLAAQVMQRIRRRRKALRWPSTSPRSGGRPSASGTCGA